MEIQGVSFNRSNCLSNKYLIPQSHSFTSSKNFNLRPRLFSATVFKSNSISYSMKSYKLSELTKPEVDSLKTRPRIDFSSIFGVVNPIVDDVRNRGDAAIVDYTAKLDKVKLDKIVERVADLPDPELDPAVREAFDVAYDNIHAFHTAQKNTERSVENMKGVRCKRISRCIKSVGLYVPGGTAVLPSTALMLSVPAQIAGCKTVVLATPPSGDGGICKEVLYCAKRAGVTHILKAGGAQAISAMAWGTASCPKEPIALPFEAASTKNAAPKAQVLKAAKALKSGESTPKKRVKKSVTFSCKKTLKKAKNPKHLGDSAPRKNKLDHYEILKYPLITELTMKKMKGKKSLVFIVDRRADKKNIKAAIENIYDTRTKKVNTLMRPDGTKKAYVTLTSDSGS